MQYQILHLMCYNVAKVKGVMIPVCLKGKEQVFIYGLMFIFNLSKIFDLSHIITWHCDDQSTISFLKASLLYLHLLTCS